jgi:predicted phosphoadenosine phosphosulfate sulfurtransferase
MSSGNWRTDKLIELYSSGNTTTQRVKEYESLWQSRCYKDGIPDCCPDKLAKSRKVPSYKAVALAILNNDLQLLSLGFAPKESKWFSTLKKIEIEERSGQASLNL